jgi:hypothetical protein
MDNLGAPLLDDAIGRLRAAGITAAFFAFSLLASSSDDLADRLAVFDIKALPAGDLESA